MQTSPSQPERILRLPEVRARYGRSRSSVYADIESGVFMRPIRLGPRSVGWPSREVDAIIAARIAGKTDDEIRAVVAKLTAARKATA
jgi:prophage regulatory protein